MNMNSRAYAAAYRQLEESLAGNNNAGGGYGSSFSYSGTGNNNINNSGGGSSSSNNNSPCLGGYSTSLGGGTNGLTGYNPSRGIGGYSTQEQQHHSLLVSVQAYTHAAAAAQGPSPGAQYLVNVQPQHQVQQQQYTAAAAAAAAASAPYRLSDLEKSLLNYDTFSCVGTNSSLGSGLGSRLSPPPPNHQHPLIQPQQHHSTSHGLNSRHRQQGGGGGSTSGGVDHMSAAAAATGATSSHKRISSLDQFLLMNPGLLGALDPTPVVTTSSAATSAVLQQHQILEQQQKQKQQLTSAAHELWLEDMKISCSGLSIEPMSGTEVLKRVQSKMDDVLLRYLPCVDFLVQCQQELRRGLQHANGQSHHHHGRRRGANGLTPRQFYVTYVQPLPQRFQVKNQFVMPSEPFRLALQGLQTLSQDAKKVERAGAEAIKNQFLGGMKEGQSWGLRKWLSQHGNALHVCTDVECIVQACRSLPKTDTTTKQFAQLLRPLAQQALDRLLNDIPKSYQEHSSAHPYLPFFHRLESCLRNMAQFDPEDDGIVVIDDSDDDDIVVTGPEKVKSLPETKPGPTLTPPPTEKNNAQNCASRKRQRPEEKHEALTLDDDDDGESDVGSGVEDIKNASNVNTGTDTLLESETAKNVFDIDDDTDADDEASVESNEEILAGPLKKRAAGGGNTTADAPVAPTITAKTAEKDYNMTGNNPLTKISRYPLDDASSSGESDDDDVIEIVAVNKPDALCEWNCPSCFRTNTPSDDNCKYCGESNFMKDLQAGQNDWFEELLGNTNGLNSGRSSSRNSSIVGEGAVAEIVKAPPSPPVPHPMKSPPKKRQKTAKNAKAKPSTELWPLPLVDEDGVCASASVMAENLDRLAQIFEQGRQGAVRPLSAPVGSFWDGERYASALRLFSTLLRNQHSAYFVKRIDDDHVIKYGHPPFSHIIKHPIGFVDIVTSLIRNGETELNLSDDDDDDDDNKLPQGVDGRLPVRGLNSWNMWKGIDLLQAIDLVLLNSLAYGKAVAKESKSQHRSHTNRMRKTLWDGIQKIIAEGVNGSSERKKLCTPTRRSESSGFVVYKIQER